MAAQGHRPAVSISGRVVTGEGAHHAPRTAEGCYGPDGMLGRAFRLEQSGIRGSPSRLEQGEIRGGLSRLEQSGIRGSLSRLEQGEIRGSPSRLEHSGIEPTRDTPSR